MYTHELTHAYVQSVAHSQSNREKTGVYTQGRSQGGGTGGNCPPIPFFPRKAKTCFLQENHERNPAKRYRVFPRGTGNVGGEVFAHSRFAKTIFADLGFAVDYGATANTMTLYGIKYFESMHNHCVCRETMHT